MRTRKELVDQSWGIALGHYLSGYPDNATPDEVFHLLREGESDVLIWEPFWYSDTEWLVEQIETMQEYIFRELLWAQGVDA